MQHSSNVPEEWRDIPGYEGYYQVSNHGEVRSLPRVVIRKDGKKMPLKGKTLRSFLDKDGYPRVNLRKVGAITQHPVHRLVLLAFLGGCPDGMQVLHGDGNPANNVISNLKYGSASENGRDSVRHGTHRNTRKSECPRGHVLEGRNLMPSALKNDNRDCLACNRTRSYLQKRPHLKEGFRDISDSYYRKIMSVK